MLHTPVIYKIEKGQLQKVDKKVKWIEVQNRAGTEKAGLLAGIRIEYRR